jgi:hypothetical protein
MKYSMTLVALFITVIITTQRTVADATGSQIKTDQNIDIQRLDTIKISDTVKFIRDNIIAHPEKFEHQPLGKMLDPLPFKVKYYIFGFRHKIGTIKDLILYFEPSETIANKFQNHLDRISITFYFENPIDATTPEPYY